MFPSSWVELSCGKMHRWAMEFNIFWVSYRQVIPRLPLCCLGICPRKISRMSCLPWKQWALHPSAMLTEFMCWNLGDGWFHEQVQLKVKFLFVIPPFSIPISIVGNTLHFEKRTISNTYLWVIGNILQTLCTFTTKKYRMYFLKKQSSQEPW